MTPHVIDVAAERAAIVAEARTWLGTPFHHAARIKNAGVDCAQLLLGVFVAVGLIAEPVIDVYPPDWFLHQDRDRLREIVSAHCVERLAPAAAVVGDILLFRYGRSASHSAIVVNDGAHMTAVHSYRLRGVIEEECGPRSPLASRLVGVWTLRRWAEA
jgi:NlpC/P60 family putative phage cell wall peptidase